jgi:acyl transferase domain-containing protein
LAIQKSNDIAIVGISMMLPNGIDNLFKLHSIIQSKQCTTRKVPLERWDAESLDLDNLIIDDGIL